MLLKSSSLQKERNITLDNSNFKLAMPKIPAFKLFALIVLLVLSNITFSQQIYHFTKGLYIQGLHHYGREALYSDSLAYRLYNHTLQKPIAGATFDKNSGGDAIVTVVARPSWLTESSEPGIISRCRCGVFRRMYSRLWRR